MKKILLGVLQKLHARRDARLAAQGLASPWGGANGAGLPPTRAPVDPAALLARGEELETARDYDGALQCYREVLALAPSALAQVCAGNALYALARYDEAEGHYRAAIDLDPAYAAARLNLGNALVALGRATDAEVSYRAAARLKPGWVDALVGIGCALEDQERQAEAATVYREALQLDPAHAGTATNLSSLLTDLGQAIEARRVLEGALQHAPGHRGLLHALAYRHQLLGEHTEAIAIYRGLLERDPHDDDVWGALLFGLNFLPGLGATTLLAEHRRWGEDIAGRIPAGAPRRDLDPARRLRVGYVSPDFRRHPVAQFMLPLLREHDAAQVETFCYANHEHDDDMTQQVRALSDHWRAVRTLDDTALAQLIEKDCIDLLVDLAGHSAGRRLGMFARKPAPVQLTWLGYLSTTGLPAMDYRICDARTDPPGAEALQTETPLRLPDAQWCYETPFVVTPAPMPFLQRGYWTFGSFNQLPKLNEPLLSSWAALLAAVPGSRLRIAGAPDASVLERIQAMLSRAGIEPGRISAAGRLPLQQYLASYAEVDVALDSYPYTGGTTTCDALLMGVPVASVAGDRPFERSGVSLLTTLGLQDWIADSLEALPALVQKRLADPARLARLREELPARMRASALMDAPRFARNLEALYREAWRRHCERQGQPRPQ